jgi:hypothetical protein
MASAEAAVRDMHFHCPECHPQLQRGVTPAICGAVIPPAVVVAGNGPRQRKCRPCKDSLRQHKASHRKC